MGLYACRAGGSIRFLYGRGWIHIEEAGVSCLRLSNGNVERGTETIAIRGSRGDRDPVGAAGETDLGHEAAAVQSPHGYLPRRTVSESRGEDDSLHRQVFKNSVQAGDVNL